jgi:hypothetical protein
MADEITGGFEGYEKWPGYQKVKQRLQNFLAVMRMGQHDAFAILLRSPGTVKGLAHVLAKQPQLIAPANKREFEASGYTIRLSFTVEQPESLTLLTQVAQQPFSKCALGEVMLCAHSGPSGNLSCIYRVFHMNTHLLAEHPHMANQLSISSLTDSRYELGFDACGNIFDSLLISDEVLERMRQE